MEVGFGGVDRCVCEIDDQTTHHPAAMQGQRQFCFIPKMAAEPQRQPHAWSSCSHLIRDDLCLRDEILILDGHD